SCLLLLLTRSGLPLNMRDITCCGPDSIFRFFTSTFWLNNSFLARKKKSGIPGPVHDPLRNNFCFLFEPTMYGVILKHRDSFGLEEGNNFIDPIGLRGMVYMGIHAHVIADLNVKILSTSILTH